MIRKTWSVFVLALVCTLSGCGGDGSNAPSGEKGAPAGSGDTTLFFGARLIPWDGSPAVENAAFLVANGKITQIGARADVKAPQGAGRTDLTGHTIMPTLINLHGHPGLIKDAAFSPKDYSKQSVENDLKRYLYYGVGAVLAPGTDKNDIAIQVRDEVNSGKVQAARLYTAGRGITAKGGWPVPILGDMPIQVGSTADAIGAVDENADKKVDFIKIWVDDNMGATPKLKPEIYKAIIDEAHKKNLRVVAHVFYLDDAKDLVKSGVDGLLHSIRDKEVDDALINDMKAKNVFITPTLTAHESKFVYADNPSWLGEQSMKEVYPTELVAYLMKDVFIGQIRRNPNVNAFREQYKIAVKNLKKMADAGVIIGLGTDSGTANTFPGYFEHREMQLMVEAGMSIPDVIKASTAIGASILKMNDGGTLAVGKRADFLSLTANPLEKITNSKEIETMFLNGSQTERTPLIQNSTINAPKVTKAQKDAEAEARRLAHIKELEDKEKHYGKFVLGDSITYKGLVIPIPRHSNSKLTGNVVTVNMPQATANDLKEFFTAAMTEYKWKAAGNCFEKAAPVTKKTNSACVDASGSSAKVTITEK